MAWSIIYEGYSKRPLSQKEVRLVETHVRKWHQNYEWEGENYAPEVQQMPSETEPNERRLVIWGSTAPDGTVDEVVLQTERILSALTELKQLLPQVEWKIIAGEEEVQWDEERQKFVIPGMHDYPLVELPAAQRTASADETETLSGALLNALVEQLVIVEPTSSRMQTARSISHPSRHSSRLARGIWSSSKAQIGMWYRLQSMPIRFQQIRRLPLAKSLEKMEVA